MDADRLDKHVDPFVSSLAPAATSQLTKARGLRGTGGLRISQQSSHRLDEGSGGGRIKKGHRTSKGAKRLAEAGDV